MKLLLSRTTALLLCAGALFSAGLSLQATPFEEGNALFKDGKFQEAEAAYNRSLAQEGDSPATRYNLGKVQEALADPARAMLEWERALRLSPDHVAARKALKAARETMGSKVPEDAWWNLLQPSFSLHREPWIAAAGAWLLASGLILALATKKRPLAGALVLAGASLGLLGAAWIAHSSAEADAALVLERAVVFRAAPANPARALDSLPAGSRLRLLDSSGGWLRAQAADRQIGWIPSASVERISP
jgi:tetratricopeptide (TPR) repeat protein